MTKSKASGEGKNAGEQINKTKLTRPHNLRQPQMVEQKNFLNLLLHKDNI